MSAGGDPKAEANDEKTEEQLPAVEYVTLKSADGHEFVIMKDCAMLSGALRAMLNSEFIEAEGVIELKELSKPVLEKVIQ